MTEYQDVRRLIDRVRSRWQALRVFHATRRAALCLVAASGVALVAARWISASPTALAVIAGVAVFAAAGGVAWALLPLRRRPTDQQIARFIEEREPGLDDRLVTAVDRSRTPPTPFDHLVVADAARRCLNVDLEALIRSESLRRAGIQAVASTLALVALVIVGRNPLRASVDAISLTLFPARVTLEVMPGHARIRAGDPFTVRARLVGNRAPVIAQVQIANGDSWRALEMTPDPHAGFVRSLSGVTSPFKYRIVAGTITSPVYDVSVIHPPRVARIDVDYVYPAGLGLPPRTERDGGDIYAPAGTDVRVHVFTDRAAATGHLTLGDGKEIRLTSPQPTEFVAALKVVDDGSYRVGLADREGFAAAGETEYFIRTLEDRPPEVRVTKPAQDRQVTRLEEVDIEAQAEDDYGLDRLDLVYVVHNKEHVAPLPVPKKSLSVKAHHTLFLEDLDVQPGDVIAYYARARDLTRGTRPNEARSDIFFLEVRPYDQEFTLAASQAMAGAGGRNSIDDLVTAQKDVIVSTFKLDRRTEASKGAKSETDIRAVSRAESELKERVEQTASTFRESTMRDPRRRPQGRGGSPAPAGPKAGDTLVEEDDMVAAAAAMTKAIASLEALNTSPALQPEMEALNHLLKAQADVKKHQVNREQAGSGAGNNRSNYDVSTLFDKELKRQQQTNYETKSTAEQKGDPAKSALDQIKELATRQDELLKRQRELARSSDQMAAEELRRELEKLTREQSELRQRAEELARQMAQKQPGQPDQQSEQGQRGQQGQQGQTGQQGQAGQGGQARQDARNAGQPSQTMRDVSEAMGSAASDLRRQDPKQASAAGNRALEKLREMQRQLESAQPDERRRALGDLQLEARQLADAQRQVASNLAKTSDASGSGDAVRRLAGEEDRLAERARKLQNGLASTGDIAKELERQRLADRMQQSADAVRATASDAAGARGRQPAEERKTQATTQQDLARALDKLGDRIAAATGQTDGESRKLSDQLGRAQQLREQIDRLGREMAEAARSAGQRGRAGDGEGTKAAGQRGRAGEGQSGGGGGSGTDLARMRQEYERRLKEAQDLLNQMRRDDPTGPTYARGGAGFTFEGQGMTLSAPGTEAFKQDFARWEELRRQATQALENAETALSKKLQAQQAKDHLASGVDDKAPAEYQMQVDSYFKAIAQKKQ